MPSSKAKRNPRGRINRPDGRSSMTMPTSSTTLLRPALPRATRVVGLVCEDVQDSGFGNRHAGQVEVLDSIDALIGSHLQAVRFDRDAATALILDWTLPDGRTAQRLAHMGRVECRRSLRWWRRACPPSSWTRHHGTTMW